MVLVNNLIKPLKWLLLLLTIALVQPIHAKQKKVFNLYLYLGNDDNSSGARLDSQTNLVLDVVTKIEKNNRGSSLNVFFISIGSTDDLTTTIPLFSGRLNNLSTVKMDIFRSIRNEHNESFDGTFDEFVLRTRNKISNKEDILLVSYANRSSSLFQIIDFEKYACNNSGNYSRHALILDLSFIQPIPTAAVVNDSETEKRIVKFKWNDEYFANAPNASDAKLHWVKYNRVWGYRFDFYYNGEISALDFRLSHTNDKSAEFKFSFDNNFEHLEALPQFVDYVKIKSLGGNYYSIFVRSSALVDVFSYFLSTARNISSIPDQRRYLDEYCAISEEPDQMPFVILTCSLKNSLMEFTDYSKVEVTVNLAGPNEMNQLNLSSW